METQVGLFEWFFFFRPSTDFTIVNQESILQITQKNCCNSCLFPKGLYMQYIAVGLDQIWRINCSTFPETKCCTCFSPPVRWGLLDFMSGASPPYPPSSPSPPSPPRPPRLQPRSCEFSVLCQSTTAILGVQCSVPDPNRDRVSSVFRAGPQPRSCEFTVPCRTSTAILWVQCSVPDVNRDPVSSVFRAGPQPRSCEEILYVRKTVKRYVRKNVRIHGRQMSKDMSERLSEEMSERMSDKMLKDMSEIMPDRMSGDMSEARRYARKNVRKTVKRYVRENVRRLPPVSLWSWK